MSLDRRRIFGLLAAAVVLLCTAQWTLRAQDSPRTRKAVSPPQDAPPRPAAGPSTSSAPPARAGALSLQDALLERYNLPFERPASLQEVADTLERTLHISVVIDRAALDRHDLTPEDTVELKLKGARLKTVLKLLLHQVGLIYVVIPEDNLLLITDSQESEDRFSHILEELKSLHRDIHDIQDSLDEILDATDTEGVDGPQRHKVHHHLSKGPS
ncbi:MAG TPA: hypothetical protein VGY53_01735 [Isosphaeraceae bacterium]|jgi:hypothetical protein|nr:hypothetical protein [Isosphaeraceae bacterium]